jgi:hypothetical protein
MKVSWFPVVFCLLETTEDQQAVFLSASRRSDGWPRQSPKRVTASGICQQQHAPVHDTLHVPFEIMGPEKTKWHICLRAQGTELENSACNR